MGMIHANNEINFIKPPVLTGSNRVAAVNSISNCPEEVSGTEDVNIPPVDWEWLQAEARPLSAETLQLKIMAGAAFRTLKKIPFFILFQASFSNTFNLFVLIVFAFCVHLRAINPCPAFTAIEIFF